MFKRKYKNELNDFTELISSQNFKLAFEKYNVSEIPIITGHRVLNHKVEFERDPICDNFALEFPGHDILPFSYLSWTIGKVNQKAGWFNLNYTEQKYVVSLVATGIEQYMRQTVITASHHGESTTSTFKNLPLDPDLEDYLTESNFNCARRQRVHPLNNTLESICFFSKLKPKQVVEYFKIFESDISSDIPEPLNLEDKFSYLVNA